MQGAILALRSRYDVLKVVFNLRHIVPLARRESSRVLGRQGTSVILLRSGTLTNIDRLFVRFQKKKKDPSCHKELNSGPITCPDKMSGFSSSKVYSQVSSYKLTVQDK